MNQPVIESMTIDGNRLTATIDGKPDVWIRTIRENLWNQAKVMLPEPFASRCQKWVISYNWDDEDSAMVEVDGCVHDPWAAGICRDFATEKSGNGTYRRK